MLTAPTHGVRGVRARTPREQYQGRRVRTVRRALCVTADAKREVDVCIVGAGVSGLSTAFTLMQKSSNTTTLVTEARDYVGEYYE